MIPALRGEHVADGAGLGQGEQDLGEALAKVVPRAEPALGRYPGGLPRRAAGQQVEGQRGLRVLLAHHLAQGLHLLAKRPVLGAVENELPPAAHQRALDEQVREATQLGALELLAGVGPVELAELGLGDVLPGVVLLEPLAQVGVDRGLLALDHHVGLAVDAQSLRLLHQQLLVDELLQGLAGREAGLPGAPRHRGGGDGVAVDLRHRWVLGGGGQVALLHVARAHARALLLAGGSAQPGADQPQGDPRGRRDQPRTAPGGTRSRRVGGNRGQTGSPHQRRSMSASRAISLPTRITESPMSIRMSEAM